MLLAESSLKAMSHQRQTMKKQIPSLNGKYVLRQESSKDHSLWGVAPGRTRCHLEGRYSTVSEKTGMVSHSPGPMLVWLSNLALFNYRWHIAMSVCQIAAVTTLNVTNYTWSNAALPTTLWLVRNYRMVTNIFQLRRYKEQLGSFLINARQSC